MFKTFCLVVLMAASLAPFSAKADADLDSQIEFQQMMESPCIDEQARNVQAVERIEAALEEAGKEAQKVQEEHNQSVQESLIGAVADENSNSQI